MGEAGKKFHVMAYFPDLTSVNAYQTWTGSASNIGMAAHLAFKDIRARQGVTKKRLKNAKLTIIEIEFEVPK
jgi:hypothetical protein